MSGKKIGQVKDVLRQAGKKQQELFDNYLKRCRNLLDKIEEIYASMETDALAGLPDSKGLKSRLQECRKNLDRLVSRMNKLEEQINKKGEKGETWYFDTEYAQAKDLSGKFTSLLSETVRPLQNEIENALKGAEGARKKKEEREQAQAEAALSMFRQKVAEKRYANPTNINEKLTLEELFTTVMGETETIASAGNNLSVLEKHAANGEWQKLLLEYDRFNPELDELICHAEECCSHERDKLFLASAIKEFLYEEGCDPKVSLVGDHLSEGLKITNGGDATSVEFVVEGGTIRAANERGDEPSPTVSFNIDNLRGRENCAEAVENLQGRLRRMGLNFTLTQGDIGKPKAEQPKVVEGRTHESRKNI